MGGCPLFGTGLGGGSKSSNERRRDSAPKTKSSLAMAGSPSPVAPLRANPVAPTGGLRSRGAARRLVLTGYDAAGAEEVRGTGISAGMMVGGRGLLENEQEAARGGLEENRGEEKNVGRVGEHQEREADGHDPVAVDAEHQEQDANGNRLAEEAGIAAASDPVPMPQPGGGAAPIRD